MEKRFKDINDFDGDIEYYKGNLRIYRNWEFNIEEDSSEGRFNCKNVYGINERERDLRGKGIRIKKDRKGNEREF